MRLRAQIIDFIRLRLMQNSPQRTAIGQIAIMQEQTGCRIVRILVQMIDAPGIESARPPDNAVYFVILRQKKIRKIRPVLPRDTGDQCSSHQTFFEQAPPKPPTSDGKDSAPNKLGNFMLTRTFQTHPDTRILPRISAGDNNLNQ